MCHSKFIKLRVVVSGVDRGGMWGFMNPPIQKLIFFKVMLKV